ncbi:CAP domain-containing protein [Flavobacterium sp. UBA7680]|uniref:CAP domain-containing protein n=1 Tax=Flavobacterium sp. UBA7680 TaxID=1946559 RepID=UPI0025C56227|nr:hypothetical protein [Flavobacterium sp. UBA7680]
MKKTILLTALFLTIIGCQKDEVNETSTPKTMTARDSAVYNYNEVYLKTNLTNSGWTGNILTCNAGTIPTTTHEMVAKRINYFRNLVGLPKIEMDLSTDKVKACQEAAFMMHANNKLSHFPTSDWKCYTADGYLGATKSNLSIGYNSTTAISNLIQDAGTTNAPVGHRRWLLYSKAKSFTSGSTGYTSAVWVHSDFAIKNSKEFTAYPHRYFPQNLVYNRWSFSIYGAIFNDAKVVMTGPSGNVALSIVSNSGPAYGDNTIVWEPTGIVKNSTEDVKYTVTVSGIKNASKTSYTYEVIIIKP